MRSKTRAALAIAFCSLLLLTLSPSTAFPQTAQEIAKKAFGSTVLLVMEGAGVRERRPREMPLVSAISAGVGTSDVTRKLTVWSAYGRDVPPNRFARSSRPVSGSHLRCG